MDSLLSEGEGMGCVKKRLRNSLQKTLLPWLLSLKEVENHCGSEKLSAVRGQTGQVNITFSHEWRQLVIHFYHFCGWSWGYFSWWQTKCYRQFCLKLLLSSLSPRNSITFLISHFGSCGGEWKRGGWYIFFSFKEKMQAWVKTLVENSARDLKCLKTIKWSVLKPVSLCLKVILIIYAY